MYTQFMNGLRNPPANRGRKKNEFKLLKNKHVNALVAAIPFIVNREDIIRGEKFMWFSRCDIAAEVTRKSK